MKTSTLMKSTAAIAFVIAGATGAIFWAHDSLAQGPMGAPMHMQHDGRHLAMMADHIAAAANATPEQKAQIDALVAAAATDFKALHASAAQDHQLLLAALTQDRVDRAALESVRTAHMQLADQGSRRLTQLIGDVADVLTPDQRRAVAARMQQLHGAH